MDVSVFEDREDAGWQLAQRLLSFQQKPDTIVLALPRGGVPVAFQVTEALQLPLDIFLVRKLGLPWQPEFAVGAIASGGFIHLDQEVIHQCGVREEHLEELIERESKELDRRETLYREGRSPLEITGKTVILVDDGLATGASMTVAVHAIRAQHPKAIVVAVPVAAASSVRKLSPLVDSFVSVIIPETFRAVGEWYIHFGQTTDEEVHTLLAAAQPIRRVAWK
jgi:putative phosphoribosyl transferase